MGSSGGNAQREAEQAEKEHQAQIRATQQRIEGAFSQPQREADIADAGFRPVNELLAQLADFETWSQICLQALFA